MTAGNCREQADGGGDQRFGNTRGDRGQGGLLGTGQAAEGVHDAPYGTEQADVRAGRTDGGQERQALLVVFLPRARWLRAWHGQHPP
ncbi:hypothetical protein PPS11_05572 [Pseudomonas putida S11]|nr:hypothetical protein PPS11_05572 [Pseudomonas putida S11]